MERIIRRSLYNYSKPTLIHPVLLQFFLNRISQRSYSVFSPTLNLPTFTAISLRLSIQQNPKQHFSTQSTTNNTTQQIKAIISDYKILNPNIVEETLGTTQDFSAEKLNLLLSQYNRDPYYEIVWRIFDLLRKNDTLKNQLPSSTYSIVLSSLGARKLFSLASSVFRECDKPDIELYEAYLEVCGRSNHFREGVQLFQEMIEKQLPIRAKTVYTFQHLIVYRDILDTDMDNVIRALNNNMGMDYRSLLYQGL